MGRTPRQWRQWQAALPRLALPRLVLPWLVLPWLILALAGAATAQLDPAKRRGADAAERLAVSEPQWLGQARAGVWQWGSWRIVVAEDPWNCAAMTWCRFVLLDRDGIIRLAGIASERPAVDNGALVWIGPDGRQMTARASRGRGAAE